MKYKMGCGGTAFSVLVYAALTAALVAWLYPVGLHILQFHKRLGCPGAGTNPPAPCRAGVQFLPVHHRPKADGQGVFQQRPLLHQSRRPDSGRTRAALIRAFGAKAQRPERSDRTFSDNDAVRRRHHTDVHGRALGRPAQHPMGDYHPSTFQFLVCHSAAHQFRLDSRRVEGVSIHRRRQQLDSLQQNRSAPV